MRAPGQDKELAVLAGFVPGEVLQAIRRGCDDMHEIVRERLTATARTHHSDGFRECGLAILCSYCYLD
jgi:hypothetical protein